MTNGEKYLKEGVSVEEFSQKLWNYIKNREMNEPTLLINDFLNMKVKPTLTEDERAILRNIPMNFMLYRNVAGGLVLRDKNGMVHYEFFMYDNLFQFIKERRRIFNRGTFERRINDGKYTCFNCCCYSCSCGTNYLFFNFYFISKCIRRNFILVFKLMNF